VIATLISSKGTQREIIDVQGKGPVILRDVMGLLKTTRNTLVRKCCIEVIPAMYKSI